MLQIGIVGLGGMGTVHINNYQHIEGCKAVAAYDNSPDAKQKAEAFKLKLYASLDEMLADKSLDIIDVCTPTFLHKEHVTKALTAGKNVICEKPLTLKSEDARGLFELAQKKGVRLFVAQVLRFAPESAVLRNLVKSGEYGKVLDASFLRLSSCPRWSQGGWLFDKNRSGHVPFDLHIHDLDLIVSLFGKPESFTYTSCGNADRDYREHYRFNYHFSDMNVVAEAAWYNADIPFSASWRVYFENAVVLNEAGKVTAYQFGREPRVFDTEEKIKIPTGINVPPTGMYLSELTHFIDCIRDDHDSEFINPDEILAAIQILESINNSDK